MQQARALRQGAENLRKLRALYQRGFAFPQWSIDRFFEFAADYKAARLYCSAAGSSLTGGSRLRLARLATEREPVNLAQKRYYSCAELSRAFGWRQGYYQTFWEQHQRLAPNIAIYTPARVALTTEPCAPREVAVSAAPVHIINSIGLALDSEEQPDFQFISALPRPYRQATIRRFYDNLFALIGRCARDLRVSEVVMSLVGAENFATLYPGGPGAFQEEIWAPSFLAFAAVHPELTFFFMGAEGSRALARIQASRPDITAVGRVPDVFARHPHALFVNAWDPLSMPGNGNCHDESLDGYVGRSTNVAAVGWPLSNPFLRAQLIG